MIEEILCMFETYQTFFTGLLGFLGVIITLLLNGKLQRDIRKREVDHQANSIRTAIRAELLMNKSAYDLRLEQFADGSENKHALLPNKIFDEVFHKLLDQLGILEEAEVEKVLHAYHLMSELPYKLRIIAGADSVGGYQDEWIRLNKEVIPVAQEMHEKFLPVIEDTIDVIGRNIRAERNKAKRATSACWRR